MSDLSDFNLIYMGKWGRNVFLVSGRIYDLAPERWEYLSCVWYGRHGLVELPDDRYLTDRSIRYKTVDALVLEADPKLNLIGQHLYDGWIAMQKRLDEAHSKPPVVILPPPEKPPELPKPKPVPVEEPKPAPVEVPPKAKNPAPTLVKFRVWFGILATGLGVAAFFYQPLKPIVALLVPFIEAILSALGV